MAAAQLRMNGPDNVINAASLRCMLKTLRREMQAIRNNWVCNKGSPRICEINVFNKPNGENDPDVNTQVILDPILRTIPESHRKISYVMYQREMTTIGVFDNCYKPEIAFVISTHQPTWAVIEPVLRPARMYFFARSTMDINNLQGFTESFLRMNNLAADGFTRVVNIRPGPNETTRVTFNVSQVNRNRILNAEGKVTFFHRSACAYDDLGLICCARCFSYDHATSACTNLFQICPICIGLHNGECPLKYAPGARRCASCPPALSGTHATNSRRCPTLIHRASILAQSVDFQYNWLLIPCCPTLY